MSNSKLVLSEVLLKILFAVSFSTVTLVACGGGVKSAPTPSGTITPPSTITLSASASPASVAYNATSVITWSASAGTTSCSSSPAGISGVTGSYTTPPLTTTTTYTIRCIGQTATDSAIQRVTIFVAPSSINSVAAACAAEPLRGTVYYYCDCGTGASTGCVPGNDSIAGTSADAPRRTIANAMTRLRTFTGTSQHTIALCKGGAFNATGVLYISNTGCTAGTTCNDIRDYSPTTFSGAAKPVINQAANTQIFNIDGNYGGLRIMNLSLLGDSPGSSSSSIGFFFYNGAHDVTMCNLDMANFDIGVDNSCDNCPGTSPTSNIWFLGNNLSNTFNLGYYGGGNGAKINYNVMEANGANSGGQHALYENNGAMTVTGIEIIGNNIHGQYGPVCHGSVISTHGAVDGLTVKDNIVSLDADKTTDACWGIEFSNQTGNAHPVYFRNTVFSGNTVINGGNTPFFVTSCPGCIIENNVIIQNWNYSGTLNSIEFPALANRGQDDTSNANVVINNTVWFGPNVTGATRGIWVLGEGTGHIIANNTVSSSQASGTLSCYRYDLPLTSYAFINNNNCYSTGTYTFEQNHGTTLTAWQTYATSKGFDSASITVPPQFTAEGTDFTPVPGSLLIGAGTALHMSTSDKAGKARPTPPAIGAYEPL